MLEAKEKLKKQDRFSYFGEVVACKLRSLNDPRLQAVAEFENKILFEVEIQSLNKQSSCPNIVLKPDNSRPGSSATIYDLSNSITPDMLSPNSEALRNYDTAYSNQNSELIELQNAKQLDPEMTEFLSFHT
nr:unnamed protein product [Callosobruchus analis]